MPSKTEELLAQHTRSGKSPNQKDWMTLIETRITEMSDYMKRVSLGTLGRQECLWPDDPVNDHPISEDHPRIRIVNPKKVDLGLRTQGIFYAPRNMRTQGEVMGCQKLWGFTRSQNWLYVIVHFKIDAKGYRKVDEVEIEKMWSLALLMLKMPAKYIWLGLGEEAIRWEDRRRELLNQITPLSRDVRSENYAMNLLIQEN